MLNLRIIPKTFDVLMAQSKPQRANQPEAVTGMQFDTIQYPQAGTSSLALFDTVRSDKTLSNMEQAGQLSAGKFLELRRIYCDILSTPTITTTASAAGSLNDLEILLKTSRATITFTMNDKPYGPYPLAAAGRLGGAVGVIAMAGTETAPARNIVQQGNNGDNGGIPMDLTIPPSTAFGVLLNFSSTAISVATYLRITLFGVLHRRVV